VPAPHRHDNKFGVFHVTFKANKYLHMKTNKKAIVLAVASGILLGVFVIQPITVSLHAFDSHVQGESWFSYLMDSYGQVLSFTDMKGTLLAMFYGVMAALFVMMITTKRRKKTE